MMHTIKQILELYKSLTSSQASLLKLHMESIDKERLKVDQEKNRKKYERNRVRYLKQKENREKRGEKMREIVKPGDLLIVEGTKDRWGLRYVYSVSDYNVVCFQLQPKRLKVKDANFKEELKGTNRITTHGWDKVKKILNKEKYVIKL